MKEKAAVIFQFSVLAVLAAIVGVEFWATKTINEVALGAIIGVFVGLPQAFESKKAE